jgi:hypothetical protein
MKKSLEDPVVFAVCVVEAGRKVVDYYMTWRGKLVRDFLFSLLFAFPEFSSVGTAEGKGPKRYEASSIPRTLSSHCRSRLRTTREFAGR